MIILTERCQAVLERLLNLESITTEKLAKHIGVSSKTIKKDLDLIEDYLSGRGIEMTRKPRHGISLKGSVKDREQLRHELNRKRDALPNTPEERVRYLLSRFLREDRFVTIQTLADELFVSKGTVISDLEQLDSLVEHFGLELDRKRNRGLRLRGEESKYRSLYAKFLRDAYDHSALLAPNAQVESTSNRRMEAYLQEEIFSGLEEVEFRKIQGYMNQVEASLGYGFTDAAYVSFFLHIVIMIARLREGNALAFHQKSKADFLASKEFSIAKDISYKIGKDFDLEIPEDEVTYVAIHIMGARVKKNDSDNHLLMQSLESDKELNQVIVRMMDEIDSFLGENLSSDPELKRCLLIHIRPSINRMMNQLPIKNPFTRKIQTNYPLAYEAAVQAFQVVRDFFPIASNEDEIAYIAMHIQAAMERKPADLSDMIQVVVACSTGIGTAQLVTAKLRRVFKQMNIRKVISVRELEEIRNEEDIDLVISTLDVVDFPIPVITVNPFLPQEDMDRLAAFTKIRAEQSHRSKNRLIERVYRRDLIFPHEKAKSREEVLEQLCRSLQDKGYVKEGFYQSVIAREALASTSYDGVAIPHGDFQLVRKSGIAVATLQETIEWNNHQVSCIFLLAIRPDANENLECIFGHLYELINDKRQLKLVMKEEDPEVIAKLLTARN